VKKLFSICVALSLLLVLGLASSAPLAAVQASITVEVTNPIAWDLSDYTIKFKTAGLLLGPADYIDIMFPTGTGLATVTSVAVTVPAIVTTYTVIGTNLRILLAGGEAIGWGVDVTIVIENVTNPAPGSYGLCVGTSNTSPICSDAGDADVVATYELTMALDPAGGGTATDMSDESPYEAGTVVSIKAEANAGYRFVNWTAAPDVVFDNANAAETNFTMPDEAVTVTANFVAVCQLTISTTTGGSVIAPGEGKFTYDAGQPVSLVAEPDDGYRFVEWTGNVATIDDLNAASTTVITDGDYSITANFEEVPLVSTGCFIATAAYGTPTAEQIDVLREFRDVVLLESAAGSRLVALYYRLGPRVADFIVGSEILRTLVRELLVDPLVWTAEVTGAIWRG
jgi:hypothetical protein